MIMSRKKPRRATFAELLKLTTFLTHERQRIEDGEANSKDIAFEFNEKYQTDISVSTVLGLAKELGIDFPRQKSLKKHAEKNGEASKIEELEDQVRILFQIVYHLFVINGRLDLIHQDARSYMMHYLDGVGPDSFVKLTKTQQKFEFER
jgi:hypothetical protein